MKPLKKIDDDLFNDRGFLHFSEREMVQALINAQKQLASAWHTIDDLLLLIEIEKVKEKKC